VDASYTRCSDGTSQFRADGFEFRITLDFDASGKLRYHDDTSLGGTICGTPTDEGVAPASDAVTCESCDILGANALAEGKRVTGSGGQGGEGGVGAASLPLCEIDASGALVLPAR